jgi:hypothetical protein
MRKLKTSDLYVGDEIRLVKNDKTAYPYGLVPDQIVRMIYFFGARKLATKAAGHGKFSHAKRFSSIEQQAVKNFLEFYGLSVKDDEEWSKAYRVIIIRFKQILDFLRHRPAFVTREIYQACKFSGYINVVKSVIFVVDENRNIVPRSVSPVSEKTPIPLAKADSMLWDIQNIALDKMLLVLQSISPADIKHANLGMKSKSLRDIFSMYHMSRLNNKNPNMTLVNLNINTSEPGQKVRAYQSYVQRNRETQR